jgi:carbonic anhydrase/acetyltransferase-like protein (isoleucine patch superfamily)
MLLSRLLLRRAFAEAVLPAKVPLNTAYFEKYTKHRNLMPLYAFNPELTHNYVAPDATVVGEVFLGLQCVVWGGAVIRGDLNSVRICEASLVGEKSVILTVSSLPTGIAASVDIGCNVYIGPRCTLVSCTVDDYVHIGAGSVILEGARLEVGCVIGPGSVVPPGRLIPAKQVWAGNPVQYVREVYEDSDYALKEHVANELEAANLFMEVIEEYGHAHMHDSKA